jgi:Icc-related predicted phosphoesterase
MKIQLVSDLHLEFSDINIQNTDDCDLLILGGDIMIAEDLHNNPEANFTNLEIKALVHAQARAQRFRDFLKRCSFQFPHVIYIAGNHEFYHGRFYASIDHLRDECAKFPNVYFLEQDTKVINDITFIGATLWTDCNRGNPLTQYHLSSSMNDYRVIRNDHLGFTKLRPAHTMERHLRTKEYIRSVVAERHDEKFVVVGHHSPSHQSVHPDYAHDTVMNGGYHSNMDEFILDHPQIKLWTHGHTHKVFDYMIGSTRVVCNPRGYEGYEPDSGWNPNIVLEV